MAHLPVWSCGAYVKDYTEGRLKLHFAVGLDRGSSRHQSKRMKIRSIDIKGFRRFESLSIADLPPARLVVMAGPNGAGKSSLFDAFAVWHQAHHFGLSWDAKYHERDPTVSGWRNQVQIRFHGPEAPPSRKAFYLRSAYRNDPEFELSNLQKLSDPSEQVRVRRMIEQDGAVSQNYQRLAADAFEDAFDKEDENLTLKEFREGAIGEIRSAVLRLFPDLGLNTLGNPLSEGTFRFSKGTVKGFSYKNLSGGEKAAFDLLLDMVVKRRTFNDTIFGIDEPEAHMNTRLQGVLLGELYDLIPNGSQMWVATHSIGMMRKARELYGKYPGEVIFLDFEGHDFDQPVVLSPVIPNRPFWERVLRVALDDLADLVAPREIIICEGNPKGAVPGKNEEHDARCYEIVFGDEYPDTKFVSGGNSKEVAGDRLRFAAVFPSVIKGVTARRLIDRDDHGAPDIADFRKQGVWTLSRRHLESYLYDEEVLHAIYAQSGRLSDFPELQAARTMAIADSVGRGNPPDDIKSAAPQIYTFIKKHLSLTGCGDNQMAFARNVLAPSIRQGMTIYDELKHDVFGP
jgi:predicted ATPase